MKITIIIIVIIIKITNSKKKKRQTTIANIARESSMIISPIQNFTAEIKRRSLSVIPKCGINAITTTTWAHISFECKIIPTKCRYFHQKIKTKIYTWEHLGSSNNSWETI